MTKPKAKLRAKRQRQKLKKKQLLKAASEEGKLDPAVAVAAASTKDRGADARTQALSYLSEWQHSRDTWRFNKVRQQWLLTNCFDKQCVPKHAFATLLSYLDNLEGSARTRLVGLAQQFVDRFEKQESSKNESEATTNGETSEGEATSATAEAAANIATQDKKSDDGPDTVSSKVASRAYRILTVLSGEREAL